MAKQLHTKLNKYPQEVALRSGEFFLLPELSIPPQIGSQPTRNVQQYTWEEKVDLQTNKIVFQPSVQQFNKFTAVEGTEISWILYATDPSNATNPNSDQNVKYFWKKDDAPISEINSKNNGKGVSGIYIDRAGSTVEATGRYICEISNQYGTTTSEPVDLEIINPLQHPKLYKNLVINGSGEGGLTQWQVDGDITTTNFTDDVWLSYNYASLPPFTFHDFKADRSRYLPIDFRFSQSNHSSLFYGLWYDWKLKDPDILNLDIKTNPYDFLFGWQAWYLSSFPAQIVDNEDASERYGISYAAFFPGLQWMDKYNENNSPGLIGLYKESQHQVLSYLTRDRIKFKKFGGKAEATLTQTVDLSQAADLIDGRVSGVQYLTAEFFAYVGAGITNYKIKAVPAGEATGSLYNWFVLDSLDYFNRINDSADLAIKLEPGTPIEIIPQVDDQTQVDLIFRRENGTEIDRKTIKGPDETDVFAIKEKVYLPISLYPVFDLFKTNNNPIQIFGQTYTTTQALQSLMTENPDVPVEAPVNIRVFDYSSTEFYPSTYFDDNGNDVAGYELQDGRVGYSLVSRTETYYDDGSFKDYAYKIAETTYQYIATTNDKTRIYDIPTDYLKRMDRNAGFLIAKIPFKDRELYIPQKSSNIGVFEEITNTRTQKALDERGAAAMFGIGADVIVPKGTRSVDIKVTFKHLSSVIDDPQPELKGWNKQEIYNNAFGEAGQNSKRSLEYGNPRCGITKVKLQLIPDKPVEPSKYVGYKLPPSQYTVLGLQKTRLYQDVHNTSQPTPFTYEYIQPREFTDPPILNKSTPTEIDLNTFDLLQQQTSGSLLVEQNNVANATGSVSGSV